MRRHLSHDDANSPQKDESRSLKTSHLGLVIDDGYISTYRATWDDRGQPERVIYRYIRMPRRRWFYLGLGLGRSSVKKPPTMMCTQFPGQADRITSKGTHGYFPADRRGVSILFSLDLMWTPIQVHIRKHDHFKSVEIKRGSIASKVVWFLHAALVVTTFSSSPSKRNGFLWQNPFGRKHTEGGRMGSCSILPSFGLKGEEKKRPFWIAVEHHLVVTDRRFLKRKYHLIPP